MSEFFLHFIWQHRLWDMSHTQLTNGERLEIIDPGSSNQDAGPDFFNAKIRTDGTLWAGNVEIHLKSSDWYVHGHHRDPAYNNVILHVTTDADREIRNHAGNLIPQYILRYHPKYEEQYATLLRQRTWIPCAPYLPQIDHLYIEQNLAAIAISRLKRKSEELSLKYKHSLHDLEEVFYIRLAANFGFKTNQLPFEMLAQNTAYHILRKHCNSLFQIEAILFGQAGLLHSGINDSYSQELFTEYRFLKHKYNLKPMQGHLWKMARMRPGNFPHIRIAQFAMLLYTSKRLLRESMFYKSADELKDLFRVATSEYWYRHYRFGSRSKKRKKRLGSSSAENILINTMLPFMFFYGEIKDQQEFKDRAFDLLEALPPEKNHIVRKWKDLGVPAENALETQGSIELRNAYCKKKKCLTCAIGKKIIMLAHEVL